MAQREPLERLLDFVEERLGEFHEQGILNRNEIRILAEDVKQLRSDLGLMKAKIDGHVDGCKEHTRGRWGLLSVVATGILALIGVLLNKLIK